MQGEGSALSVLFIVDINECLTDNGGCHIFADCTNTLGSFSCMCKDGYELANDMDTCTSKSPSLVLEYMAIFLI